MQHNFSDSEDEDNRSYVSDSSQSYVSDSEESQRREWDPNQLQRVVDGSTDDEVRIATNLAKLRIRRGPTVTVVDQAQDCDKEYRKALNKLMHTYYTNLILQEPSKHFADPRIAAYYEGKTEEKASGSKYVGALIVINPDPKKFTSVLIPTLINHIKKAVSKKWIARYIWNLEQRQTEDTETNNPGIHVNIAVTFAKDKCKSAVHNEMYSTFSFCTGKPGVHVTMGKDMANFHNYVKGIKNDPEKMALVEQDRKWRKSIGLEDFYEGPSNL